ARSGRRSLHDGLRDAALPASARGGRDGTAGRSPLPRLSRQNRREAVRGGPRRSREGRRARHADPRSDAIAARLSGRGAGGPGMSAEPPSPARIGPRVRLAFPEPRDGEEFIALNRASRGFHRGLTSPPTTLARFERYL